VLRRVGDALGAHELDLVDAHEGEHLAQERLWKSAGESV
jgi:hypothetical protein